MISVVVPAHNEERVIGRLLRGLLSTAAPGELDVIVVANGCTDDTVGVAERFSPDVRIVTSPVPSKREAIRAGDRLARAFPRLYVDADVELDTAGVRALAAALRRPGVLAAAPERVLRLADRPVAVRWYYDVWLRLPEVRRGLFGRGVIAVGEAGHARLDELPPVLADDLAASLAFASDEAVVVADAKVVIHPSRTWGDLMRRRTRALVGVAQIEREETVPGASARTSLGDLLALGRRAPWLAPKIGVFCAAALFARRRARTALRDRDYVTWLRDDSSRV